MLNNSNRESVDSAKQVSAAQSRVVQIQEGMTKRGVAKKYRALMREEA